MNKLIKNSLGYDTDLYIYQDKKMFNYSVDTILLGNFVTLNNNVKNMLEIGTNNAALAIFIASRDNKLYLDALEIQSRAVEIAKLNIQENNMKNINIIHEDFNLFFKKRMQVNAKKYDSIVCNPPFYKLDSNLKRVTSTEEMLIATHEVKLNLEQIIEGSSKIIQQKGYLSFVLPISRFVDCIYLLRKYNFEPKRIQMVYPREQDKASFVLIESRFNTGWGTHFEPNIYLHFEDKFKHAYRDEVVKLYKPIKKENYEKK